MQFGVLWLNREPVVNKNARNLLSADFVLRRRFQDLRFTEQNLDWILRKAAAWLLPKVPAAAAADLILRTYDPMGSYGNNVMRALPAAL